MRLLREERAVEHRDLQHRNLQPREQRLDAVRQVARLEDEVEQHRDHLDRHRLELVRALAERRFLQVAQHVVHALRDSGERDLHRLRRRSRSDPAAAASGLRANPASRRSARPAHSPTVSAAATDRRASAAADGRTAESRRARPSGGTSTSRRLRPRRCCCCASGLPSAARLPRRGRLAAARAGGAHGARRHDAQVREMTVDVGVDRRDFAERRLVQLLQDLEFRAAFRLAACRAPRRTR